MKRSQAACLLAELPKQDSPELTYHGDVPSAMYWENFIRTGASSQATREQAQAWADNLLQSSEQQPLVIGKSRRVQLCFHSYLTRLSDLPAPAPANKPATKSSAAPSAAKKQGEPVPKKAKISWKSIVTL